MTMKMQPISRRALAAGLALVPVAGLPALAGAAPTVRTLTRSSQPSRAIGNFGWPSRWRAIEQIASCADEQGREVTQEDEDVYAETRDAEDIAMDNLLATPPTTKAGARAAIEYLLHYDRGCEPRAIGAFAATMLKSSVLEADGRA